MAMQSTKEEFKPGYLDILYHRVLDAIYQRGI